MEPDKIILTRWVDHALKQALTKSISSLSLGHQVYGIWIQMQ
jgi:hypothetical protein